MTLRDIIVILLRPCSTYNCKQITTAIFTNLEKSAKKLQCFRIILRDIKNYIHINLTLQRTTKNSLSRAEFELASSGFWIAALQIDPAIESTGIGSRF